MGRASTRQRIELSDAERERLEGIMNNPQTLRKHAWRAHIILELGAGCGPVETMRRTGMSTLTVWRRWDRFLAEGVDGLLHDATRPPGRKPIPEDRVKALTALAMPPPQPGVAVGWNLRPSGKPTPEQNRMAQCIEPPIGSAFRPRGGSGGPIEQAAQ